MSSEDYVMVNIFDHGGHMTPEEMEMYGPLERDAESTETPREQILNHIIDSTDDLLENVFAVGLNIRYGWSSYVCRDARPKMLKQPLGDDEGRTILHTIYDTNKETHERDGEIYLWTKETGMPNLMISSDQFPSMGIHIPDTGEDSIATFTPPQILKEFYGGRQASVDAVKKIGAAGGNIYIPLYIIIEWLKRKYEGKKIILLITNCQVVSSDISPELQKEIADTYVRGELAGKMLIDTIDSMSSLNSKIEVWKSINEERKEIRETESQSLAADSQYADGFGTGEEDGAWIDEAKAKEEMRMAKERVGGKPTDDITGLKGKINYLIDVFNELDSIQKPPGGGSGGGAAAYGGNGGKRKRRKTKRKSRRQIGCGIKKKHTRRRRTKRTKKNKRNKKRVTKQKRYKRK